MKQTEKKRLLGNWIRNTFPGVSVDLGKYSISKKTYPQLKAEIRKKIKDKDIRPVFAAYRPLYRAVEKICSGHSHLAFIKGRGGLGKSYTIKKILDESAVPYHEVNSDCTEAYLFRLLYEQNGKVIWFKDINKLLKGLRSMNVLKSATEMESHRKLTRNSYSMHEVDLPYEFDFTGSIIFDYNEIGNKGFKEDFEALVSRGDFVDVLFSHKEMCGIMKAVAQNKDERMVTDFLIDHYTDDGMNMINMRSQQKAFKTYYYALATKRDWKLEILQEIQSRMSPIKVMLHRLIGDESIDSTELKKRLLRTGLITTLRTADRRVQEWILVGELHKHSKGTRNFKIGIHPKKIKVLV